MEKNVQKECHNWLAVRAFKTWGKITTTIHPFSYFFFQNIPKFAPEFIISSFT